MEPSLDAAIAMQAGTCTPAENLLRSGAASDFLSPKWCELLVASACSVNLCNTTKLGLYIFCQACRSLSRFTTSDSRGVGIITVDACYQDIECKTVVIHALVKLQVKFLLPGIDDDIQQTQTQLGYERVPREGLNKCHGINVA